ncbi:unnamed protein product [Adineta steineri]|uniref:Uncharacterized protein n=1 Tax=Adineta steineri TaxID=433720 RepID=A0A819UNQ0_9BILA|nr:unnamed protein product [Adineta steineri]CAF1323117.1 unnamed protein product [Adineta steineri]CAF3670712.1 unnamed protein product [Adineta steineri]CAF4097002.1 unnamed protein product [Adineta steineri]
MSEHEISLEDYSKKQLIEMLNEKNQIIKEQGQLLEDLNLQKIQNDETNINQISVIYKRSSTIINIPADDTSGQLSINSPDGSSTDHNESVKSVILKYKYCILNFIGSVITTIIINSLDILPKWLVLIILLFLFMIVDLSCYKYASILVELYGFFKSLKHVIKSNDTQDEDLEAASSYSSTTHDD